MRLLNHQSRFVTSPVEDRLGSVRAWSMSYR